MGYLYLLSSIIAACVGNVLMKKSDGFKNKIVTISAISCYTIVPVFLILSINYIEVGIVYAVWSGSTILIVAILGMLFFNESIGRNKILALVLISLGVIMIQLSS
ncbi:multidrug efflux SMR transporter [Geomicrobium sp. JCM 19038]|uniref:DMT family transporter n=1 Tax=Geomicrobium sp. JCM 19038 TaxID=1460635 RepID=UPI0005A840E8